MWLKGHMVRCRICDEVYRKAQGESWETRTCSNCYRLLEHFTWVNRWVLTRAYLKFNDFAVDSILTKFNNK